MNLSRQQLEKYYEVLELKPDASYQQVKNAHMRLKKLYSSETLIITPILSDFPKRKRTDILRQLETAYNRLVEHIDHERRQRRDSVPKTVSEETQDVPMKPAAFTGSTLRYIRRKLGFQLFDVSLDTKIRKDLIKCIESEKFEELPPEIYLKAHLKTYAKFLSLNPKKVIDDYMSRYRAWKKS